MPQKTRSASTRKTAPRKATGDAAIRADVEARVTDGAPVTIPTTDSKHQAHVREVIEKMRDGKGGKPYRVEANPDGTSLTVSLPEQPFTS